MTQDAQLAVSSPRSIQWPRWTDTFEVDSDYLDFGDVPFSEMVEASFEVTNVGDATLLFAEKPFIEVKDGC